MAEAAACAQAGVRSGRRERRQVGSMAVRQRNGRRTHYRSVMKVCGIYVTKVVRAGKHMQNQTKILHLQCPEPHKTEKNR